MDIYTWSVIIFFAVLGIAIYKDRKNVEINYILFLRRTKKGIKILNRIARYQKFWKIVGTIGIFFAFYLMFTGFWSLVEYGRRLIAKEINMPGISFVFPSPTSNLMMGPGYILIPFWFWIVIIASVMVPHEVFHGIISSSEKIRIKSAGLLLFGIFPGAFVEPDEKQLKKAKFLTKLRIFAAGSFANFMVSLLVLFLLSNVVWNYYVPGPIVLTDVNSTSPAEKAGLRPGMIISEINGKQIKVTYSEFLSRSYLSEQAGGIKIGDQMVVTANDTNFTLTVGSNPENQTQPYIGVVFKPVITGNSYDTFDNLFQLLTWMSALNLAIAVVNILPIYPLDGGLIVEAIAEKINKKHAKQITIVITLITLSIFFVNFATPFLLK